MVVGSRTVAVNGSRVIVIKGNNWTLDAHGIGTLFHITNAALILQGPLTLLNGSSHPAQAGPVQGGAVYVDANATLNASNVIFSHGIAEKGGAVYVKPYNLLPGCKDRECHSIAIVTDCLFVRNWAENGGALELSASYLDSMRITFTSEIVVKGCTFKDNGGVPKGAQLELGRTATGGAIRVESDGDTRADSEPATTARIEAGNVFVNNNAVYGRSVYADRGTAVYFTQCGSDGADHIISFSCHEEQAAIELDADCSSSGTCCTDPSLRCPDLPAKKKPWLVWAFIITLSCGVIVTAVAIYARKMPNSRFR
jgi:hypothetical protein